MICSSCSRLIQMALSTNGIHLLSIKVGKATVQYDEAQHTMDNIAQILKENGFELAKNKDQLLVDQIKKHVIDLVFHMNNMNSIVQKSDYLVEMLDMNYQHISRIFRKNGSITLEKYIILIKIERIKQMLEDEDYTLSEIAFMMDYSSVQYLSMQFKRVTGITVTEYKTHPGRFRIPLDKLY